MESPFQLDIVSVHCMTWVLCHLTSCTHIQRILVNMSAELSMIWERTQQELPSHAKVGCLHKANSYLL